MLGDRLGEALAGLSQTRREEAASLVETLDANDDLETAAAKVANELVARGEIAPEAQEETSRTIALAVAEALTDPEANAQLAACVVGGRQGFNLHDWLFPRAHAAAPAGLLGAVVAPGVAQACKRAVAVGAAALARMWSQIFNNDANDRPGIGHNNPPGPIADGDTIPNQPPQGPGNQLGTIIAGGAVVGSAGDPQLVPGGGLQAHERAGGHLIARHVGKTDADLAARLQSAPGLSTVSTFPDMLTAERAISAAIAANQVNLQAFAAGTRARTVIEHDLGYTVGTVMVRGASSSAPATRVRLVIDRDPRMPNGFRITTGFPLP